MTNKIHSNKAHKGMIGIFQIMNMVTGDRFVGMSPSLGNTYRRYHTLLLNGGHYNEELQQQWDQHGPVNFNFSILELCKKKKELSDRLAFYLQRGAKSISPQKKLSSHTGFVSIDKELKEEIRELNDDTFDNTVKKLIDFYKRDSND